MKSSKWKRGTYVKVIATISRSPFWKPGQRHENETVEFMMTEHLKEDGKCMKKMDAEKFYYLYYQLTELIPLFSYLERLNALRCTMTNFETQGDEGQEIARR